MSLRSALPLALAAGVACATQPVPRSEPMRIISTIQLESPTALAYGMGSIWTTEENRGLLRIDPATGDVEEAIDLGHRGLCCGGSQIAIYEDEVWMALPVGSSPIHGDPYSPDPTGPPTREPAYKNFRQRMVEIDDVETTGGIAVIDAARGTVDRRILFLDLTPWSLAVTDEGAWLPAHTVNGRRTLALIDRRTYEFTRFVDVKVASGAVPGVVAGGGSLWVVVKDGIARIDPRDGSILANISISQARSIAFGEDALWVRTEVEIVKIERATNEVAGRVSVANARDVAVGDGVVLVWGSWDEPTLYRIDPVSMEITGTLDLGPGECEGSKIAFGEGTAWVAHDCHLLEVSV